VARIHLASIEVQSVSSLSGITDTDNTAEENENANALADSAATDGREMSLTASPHPITAAILTASLSSSNTNMINGSLPFNLQKGLVQKSRCTPQQKMAFEAERTKVFKCKRIAYGWAVQHVLDNKQEASTPKSIQDWAIEASEIFGVDVKGETIRKMIKNGDILLQAPGPTMAMGDEAYSCTEHAILSNTNLCQRNGDTDLKEATIVAIIEALLKGNTTPNIPQPRYLWRKVTLRNSVILELSKEHHIELRHQMWTTVKNLDEWYDRWKRFFLEFAFGDSDGKGGIVFSEEQKRRIVNMDETKFSTDGSDGGIGGRPANSITLLGVARAGTSMNKASMSSTLMCSSNAACEALPVHVMFSYDDQEENYQVDARWLANFPHMVARFENEEDQDFCAQITVNEKGGSDSRFLHQALTCYTRRLYPDASDLPGHRV
jgi:hypothetical protein